MNLAGAHMQTTLAGDHIQSYFFAMKKSLWMRFPVQEIR
jgi:hypothetical protein